MYDTTFGFAETVTGPSGDFAGVFSREYYQADAGGTVPVSSSTPLLRCRDADALTKGQAVTVRGDAFTVVEVMPSGYGETIMRLQG